MKSDPWGPWTHWRRQTSTPQSSWGHSFTLYLYCLPGWRSLEFVGSQKREYSSVYLSKSFTSPPPPPMTHILWSSHSEVKVSFSQPQLGSERLTSDSDTDERSGMRLSRASKLLITLFGRSIKIQLLQAPRSKEEKIVSFFPKRYVIVASNKKAHRKYQGRRQMPQYKHSQ